MWREGGPAQVPSNPHRVPAPPAHPRVAELTRQIGGPAPPASPTFRRPLGSARASRLRSSARKGRFVRAPRAPRHRAARAADPGTRPSRGRDWGPARASFPYVRGRRSQKHAGSSPRPRRRRGPSPSPAATRGRQRPSRAATACWTGICGSARRGTLGVPKQTARGQPRPRALPGRSTPGDPQLVAHRVPGLRRPAPQHRP